MYSFEVLRITLKKLNYIRKIINVNNNINVMMMLPKIIFYSNSDFIGD